MQYFYVYVIFSIQNCVVDYLIQKQIKLITRVQHNYIGMAIQGVTFVYLLLVQKSFSMLSFNVNAFAAIKSDKTVIAWGNVYHGGDASSVSSQLVDVASISSTEYAFSALKSDGKVVSWGNVAEGGNNTAVIFTAPVVQIAATYTAFAALQSDSSVKVWGNKLYGGSCSSPINVCNELVNDVVTLYSNYFSFCALKVAGKVVCWGDNARGGNITSVSSALSSNVKLIFSTRFAHAALKYDGTVVCWGTQWGNALTTISSVTYMIYTNYHAFAAVPDIYSNAKVTVWGKLVTLSMGKCHHINSLIYTL